VAVIALLILAKPFPNLLHKEGIKRGLAVLLLAVIFVGVLALVFWLLTQACESAITALWQGARSPGKFPDHEILPVEHGRPCGDLARVVPTLTVM
jgi:predicted PurR-regulated permease PerM